MTKDLKWQADLARYGLKRIFLKEQAIWAIWTYRWGQRIDARQDGLFKKLLTAMYWPIFRFIETFTGVSLPKSATIGAGLKIWHFGGIFVHPQAVIGENCILRQGVTIGNRHEDGPVPVIGDNVEFGAYAQVIGGVKIGDNCRVGIMAVVLSDVPSGATVVGSPARVVSSRSVKPLEGIE